jgi:monoterpene epsilon-lactone hydrolase
MITGALPPVPISSFLSGDAKAQLTARLRMTGQPSIKDGVEAVRHFSVQTAQASLDRWLEIYPATIDETTIGGAAVDIVTPKAGIKPRNENRVLINAHMGGVFTGGRYGGQLEAVPLAGHAGITIYAVDYRMAPEHIFPAASEDMETIYRHVLETTKPENVGIYGCSAGGTLTGQMMAWFLDRGLPLPGAIGIMCAGIMNRFWFGGDSGQTSLFLNARPQAANTRPDDAPRDYFDGIDVNTSLITTGEFPNVPAQFPPTLVVTGTRDIAMSNALMTHTSLLKAGV